MSVPASAQGAIFAAALQHHRAGRLDQAAQFYQRVLQGEPGHTGALFNLAALAAQLGHCEQAMVLYEQVLALAPEDPDTLCNLGTLEMARQRLAEAEALYRRAVAARPDLAAAHANIGTLCIRQGRAEEALPAFEAALARQPALTAALNGRGTALQMLGRTVEARHAFEAALASAPADPDAHNNLATLIGTEDPAAAEAHFREALALRPDWPQVRFNLANLLGRQKRALAAYREYRRVLALDPGHVESWRAMAELVHRRGHPAQALALLRRARRLVPDSAALEFQMGNLLHGELRIEEAIAHYRRGLQIEPDAPELYSNLGSALLAIHHAEAAVEAHRRAIALRPDFVFAHNNLGNALAALNRPEEACDAYRRSVEIDPDFVVGLINFGNSLRILGRYAEARAALERAIELAPEDVNAHNNLGLVFQVQNRHEQAIACFRQALECHPQHAESLNNLAVSFQAAGAFGKAIRLYRDVVALYPDRSAAYFNLGGALQVIGRYDESVTVFQQALRVRPEYNAVYPYLAHGLMQQCSWANLDAITAKVLSNAEAELAQNLPVSISCFGLMGTPAPMQLRHRVARQMASRIADAVQETRRSLAFIHARRERRRIRVGYVSPDFRLHSVAVAFRGLLDAHDREAFELCGYSLATMRQDDYTAFFRERFHRFHDVSGLSFRQAAERIHRDEIDILIDLAGHTRFTRLEIFALQPAPVQAHYLGYSSTIGGDFLQYLITDRHQIAPGVEHCFSEKLVYLPDTFMATTRAEVGSEPVARRDFGLPDHGFVFCNFNAHYKFEPRLWGIWMRLLKQVPDSVLWLLNGTPSSERNLRREAEIRGVQPDRLVFSGKLPHPQHLARHRLADVALDTLHHGGGVTTVDALWVGLPVITVAGESPPSRNGASLLAAIGLDEMIAGSVDAYEETALTLARHPERLAAIREKLARNRSTHPLFDTERLTRHLEIAYRMMWQRWLDGLPPAAIDVPALPPRDA